MESAEISKSQDLAAAIALPPASNIIFLPCNIISIFFMRKKAGGVYHPHPSLSLKQVFETLSGGWPCHDCQSDDCNGYQVGTAVASVTEASDGTKNVECQDQE
jgi:hypothetical protein